MRWCSRSKKIVHIPVILFPGTPHRFRDMPMAFYLSLISGRNPELLIGQHVISAPFVRQSGLEIISTGYIVIDGGAPTTVSYISNASPVPADKNEIAMCTAMAGEMLGMKLIYMDAGSGAKRAMSEEMISLVSRCIEIPLAGWRRDQRSRKSLPQLQGRRRCHCRRQCHRKRTFPDQGNCECRSWYSRKSIMLRAFHLTVMKSHILTIFLQESPKFLP